MVDGFIEILTILLIEWRASNPLLSLARNKYQLPQFYKQVPEMMAPLVGGGTFQEGGIARGHISGIVFRLEEEEDVWKV